MVAASFSKRAAASLPTPMMLSALDDPSIDAIDLSLASLHTPGCVDDAATRDERWDRWDEAEQVVFAPRPPGSSCVTIGQSARRLRFASASASMDLTASCSCVLPGHLSPGVGSLVTSSGAGGLHSPTSPPTMQVMDFDLQAAVTSSSQTPSRGEAPKTAFQPNETQRTISPKTPRLGVRRTDTMLSQVSTFSMRGQVERTRTVGSASQCSSAHHAR
eukprot:TRINITY_DN41073_c0_g1_i2.p1 TRINITY_DN41073_c0_g1~~TRINITY_DN41073_c0_g1_i2.p1  ORF type:complete len:217 (+),score=14.77 TRINITY_DN41073_c0_g1_i2:109-759(+)